MAGSTQRTKRGSVTPLVIGAVVLVGALGVTTLVVRNGNGSGREAMASADRFNVRKGTFEITIPASGELAAMRQIVVRNRLEDRAVLTEIVAEGKNVKAGDVLFRLADKEMRNKVQDAEDAATTQRAAANAAKSALDLLEKARNADLSKARVAIELADIGLKAWENGEVVSKRKQLALDKETAQKNFERLDARYKQSQKLFEQKFISLDELQQDEISMIESRAKVEQVNIETEVYEQYIYHQDRKTKESELDQARDEHSQIEQRYATEIETARVKMQTENNQLKSREDRLADLQKQLEYCVVIAPSDGLVVYYSSLEGGWGRNDGQPPRVGTELRPNEEVIILPDTSEMIANVKVTEALSGQIAQGLPATITSDAMPHISLRGEVLSVGVLAETGGWRDPNRRDYTVRIRLMDPNTLGLKPSMRCKADISLGRVDDALYVPVQAVFREGALTYAFVPTSGGYAARQVQTGRTSEINVEITSGLTEGEVVLLRTPRREEIVGPMPKGVADRAKAAAGDAAPSTEDAAGEAAPARPREGSGPRRGGEGRPAPGGSAPAGEAGASGSTAKATDTPQGEKPASNPESTTPAAPAD